MEAPDFWDNAEISQKKMKELKSMKDDMETYQNLVTQKEDMETLIEMSYEENDPSMIEEIQEMAEKIHAMGPKKIAITGIVQGGFIANFLRRRAAAESAAYPQRRNTAFRNRRYLCIHHRSRCRQRSAVL